MLIKLAINACNDFHNYPVVELKVEIAIVKKIILKQGEF